MSGNKPRTLEPNAPSRIRDAVQRLGVCSPATLDRLAREVEAGRHRHCQSGETEPCDACNARNAAAAILKAVRGEISRV